jgi:Uma2 family endonuclease
MAALAPPYQKLYTADDLLAMPRDSRYELVRGELVPMSPPPGEQHGELAMTLSARATVYVQDHDLGRCLVAETGVLIGNNPDTVRAPDWAFTRKKRLHQPASAGHARVVPDVVLEVRSPSDSRAAFAERAAMWINAGVQMVWMLDPAQQTLTVHREHEVRILGADDVLTGEDLLPGFELPLSRLFS